MKPFSETTRQEIKEAFMETTRRYFGTPTDTIEYDGKTIPIYNLSETEFGRSIGNKVGEGELDVDLFYEFFGDIQERVISEFLHSFPPAVYEGFQAQWKEENDGEAWKEPEDN